MKDTFLKQAINLQFKQNQHLLLSVGMRQAFHVLQMPVLELSEWLKIQIDQNPILEYENYQEICEESPDRLSDEIQEIDFDKSGFEILESMDETFEGSAFSEGRDWSGEKEEKRLKNFQETLIPYKISLFEHLMQQAKQVFQDAEDLRIAEMIIGNLDEKGFLNLELVQIDAKSSIDKMQKILEQIQTFEPCGVAAQNLNESLLIQLKIKGKESSLAYKIVELHFDDLIHNRIPFIQKKLKCARSDLYEAIQVDIAPLDVHPGYRFYSEPCQSIIPDVYLRKQYESWVIEINRELLPQFRICSSKFQSEQFDFLSSKEKQYIQKLLVSGKWLSRIVQKRHETLKKIVGCLIIRQSAFFNEDKKKLSPLTMTEIANELGLHESTIARAVQDKYIACPHGIFSLRSFFTSSLQGEDGEQFSNSTVKQVLAKLIHSEDKACPLSDQELSREIKKLGMPCARRTVAKYRNAMKINPASRRRKFLSAKM